MGPRRSPRFRRTGLLPTGDSCSGGWNLSSASVYRLLEKPEYKRRWAQEPWEKRQERALREWLLDRLEDRRFWFDPRGGRCRGASRSLPTSGPGRGPHLGPRPVGGPARHPGGRVADELLTTSPFRSWPLAGTRTRAAQAAGLGGDLGPAAPRGRRRAGWSGRSRCRRSTPRRLPQGRVWRARQAGRAQGTVHQLP